MQITIEIIQKLVETNLVNPSVFFKKPFEAIPNITAKNKYKYPEILNVIIIT